MHLVDSGFMFAWAIALVVIPSERSIIVYLCVESSLGCGIVQHQDQRITCTPTPTTGSSKGWTILQELHVRDKECYSALRACGDSRADTTEVPRKDSTEQRSVATCLEWAVQFHGCRNKPYVYWLLRTCGTDDDTCTRQLHSTTSFPSDIEHLD